MVSPSSLGELVLSPLCLHLPPRCQGLGWRRQHRLEEQHPAPAAWAGRREGAEGGGEPKLGVPGGALPSASPS